MSDRCGPRDGLKRCNGWQETLALIRPFKAYSCILGLTLRRRNVVLHVYQTAQHEALDEEGVAKDPRESLRYHLPPDRGLDCQRILLIALKSAR